MASHRVSLISLGCPKNLVDSEGMVTDLMRNDAEMVVDPAEADVVVVNTCGFLGSAREESLGAIRKAVALKEQGVKAVFVTGCMVGNYRDQILAAVPGVDRLIDFADYGRINEFVTGYLPSAGLASPGFVSPGRRIEARLTPAHFAYLKISEGCNHTCSFCVIPKIRGRMQSFPLEDLAARARRLADMGAREINVVAQDSTMYGIDLYGRMRIVDLLGKLTEIEKVEWVRLLYAYPTEVDDELVALLAAGGKVLPYIDVPIQHASDRVLQLMKRRSSKAQIEDMIGRLRRASPEIVIRTTMIVGFPGETEVDFQELLDFVAEHRIDRLGAFTYSPEEGSAAFALGDAVAPEVREERLHRLMSLQKEIARERNQRFVGRNIRVLVEDPGEGAETAIGRSHADAPEIDGRVYVSGGPVAAGSMVEVAISRADAYDLHGRVVE